MKIKKLYVICSLIMLNICWIIHFTSKVNAYNNYNYNYIKSTYYIAMDMYLIYDLFNLIYLYYSMESLDEIYQKDHLSHLPKNIYPSNNYLQSKDAVIAEMILVYFNFASLSSTLLYTDTLDLKESKLEIREFIKINMDLLNKAKEIYPPNLDIFNIDDLRKYPELYIENISNKVCDIVRFHIQYQEFIKYLSENGKHGIHVSIDLIKELAPHITTLRKEYYMQQKERELKKIRDEISNKIYYMFLRVGTSFMISFTSNIYSQYTYLHEINPAIASIPNAFRIAFCIQTGQEMVLRNQFTVVSPTSNLPFYHSYHLIKYLDVPQKVSNVASYAWAPVQSLKSKMIKHKKKKLSKPPLSTYSNKVPSPEYYKAKTLFGANKNIKFTEVIEAIKKKNYKYIRTTGSHHRFYKEGVDGKPYYVTVPFHQHGKNFFDTQLLESIASQVPYP